MCGRYAALRDVESLAGLYGVERVDGEPRVPQFNIAPTDSVYAILERAPKDHPGHQPERVLKDVRWGLVPSWAKGVTGPPLINARIETVDVKPSWKRAFTSRRCIIPADGYYEWTSEPNEVTGKTYKQPWYLHPAESAVPLNFAGLYELWRDPSKADDDHNRWLWSATIITCEATGPAGEVHDRTPVVIPDNLVDRWLDPVFTEPDLVKALLVGITPPLLRVRPVRTLVNRVGTNGPELIEPLGGAAEVEGTLQLAVA